jgi:hypothetical protein
MILILTYERVANRLRLRRPLCGRSVTFRKSQVSDGAAPRSRFRQFASSQMLTFMNLLSAHERDGKHVRLCRPMCGRSVNIPKFQESDEAAERVNNFETSGRKNLV